MRRTVATTALVVMFAAGGGVMATASYADGTATPDPVVSATSGTSTSDPSAGPTDVVTDTATVEPTDSPTDGVTSDPGSCDPTLDPASCDGATDQPSTTPCATPTLPDGSPDPEAEGGLDANGNCVWVLGVKLVRGGTGSGASGLPFTGFDVLPLLVLGVGLVALGTAAQVGARLVPTGGQRPRHLRRR